MVFGMGKDKKPTEEAKQEESLPPVPNVSSTQPDPFTSDPVLSQMPRPSSVFEFGPLVQMGSDYMRGVCTGDNPDAIQACTWTIEEAQGKPKEKKHVFRVEF
ncbi:hypothetical protein Vafri_4517 [Volvox africanus]|uniref:Uncharacterized protein n=1 Tax=Volvox africanus TaxID=51714 RepID=A0A8J4AVD2_9CHLO|nr:hypothetical protein Vafri_4517 [Volvox africanus]